jgi:hypothetical protein
MKNKKYEKCQITSKSNQKIVEKEAKSIHLTHIYMTIHSPGMVQAHIHDHSLSSLGTGTSDTKLRSFAKLDA